MCDRAQAVVAVVSGEGVSQSHFLELVHGPRCEPVAAGLLAGEVLLLQHDDVESGTRGPVGRGAARGSSADHQQVVYAVVR